MPSMNIPFKDQLKQVTKGDGALLSYSYHAVRDHNYILQFET